jgi:3-oxoadipate enol-lactonase
MAETDGPDVRLHYAVDGAGARSLILLHELGGGLHSFGDPVPLLKTDFRILRYDQRGCGSSAVPDGPYPFSDHVRDLAHLVKAAGLKPPFHLVGQAAGAAIAVAFAQAHAADIGALALCCPALEVSAERRIYLAERSALAAREGMAAVVEDTLSRSYPEKFRKRDPARYERYRTDFLATDPVGYCYLNMAFADVSLTGSLGAIKMPCLFLAGSDDALRLPDQVKALAARVTGAQYAVIDSAHIMPVQAPAELAQRLRAFFAR